MKNERGMTLVELLAAIAIFSMIVGVLYSLFAFAQASWKQTEGSARTETQLQELKSGLTRELASPVSLIMTNNELRFETHENTFNRVVLENDHLHHYQSEESYSASSLLLQFTLPVKQLELFDKNKNPIPEGTELTEGYAYLKVSYIEDGLKSKPGEVMIPINLFSP